MINKAYIEVLVNTIWVVVSRQNADFAVTSVWVGLSELTVEAQSTPFTFYPLTLPPHILPSDTTL